MIKSDFDGSEKTVNILENEFNDLSNNIIASDSEIVDVKKKLLNDIKLVDYGHLEKVHFLTFSS